MTVLAGLLLVVTAVFLVIEPLIRAAQGRPLEAGESLFTESEEDDPRRALRERALAALREIEFDKATGKLSDEDYSRLYGKYSAEAVALHRADERIGGSADEGRGDSADAVEALIRSARAPGSAAKFCEECGTTLEGRRRFCVECGRRVTESPAGA